VRFLGPLDATVVADWMRASDVLVMTSRNEGLPNVVLEAQACGLPVVATRVGGIHEVVDAPWKGDLTPPGDLMAWSAAVLARLEQSAERARLADLGMARAWPNVAATYEAALNTALAQPGGRAD
jgi:glycosyltransferase involved in cell wall biosynthesis